MNQEQISTLGEITTRTIKLREFIETLEKAHFQMTYLGAISAQPGGSDPERAFWWMYENFDLISSAVGMMLVVISDTETMLDNLWEDVTPDADDAPDENKEAIS